MPEFTYHPQQICTQLVSHDADVVSSDGKTTYRVHLGGEREWPTCTCPAYRYPKQVENFGGRAVPVPCKHIHAAEKARCSWQSSDPETVYQRCPQCGGPVTSVMVAA